jgi:hypothetical protein
VIVGVRWHHPLRDRILRALGRRSPSARFACELVNRGHTLDLLINGRRVRTLQAHAEATTTVRLTLRPPRA